MKLRPRYFSLTIGFSASSSDVPWKSMRPSEEQIRSIRNRERLGSVMVGDEDSYILVFQPVDHRLNLLHGNRVDSGKGFVQHDEFGADGQTSRYLRAPPLSSGESVSEIFAHLLQTELIYQRLQFLMLLLLRHVGHLKHCPDVVLHREFAEDGCLLREIADSELRPFVDGERGYILVVEIYLTPVGCDEAYGHIERRGLPRTVRTEQTHDLTLRHLDADMIGHCAPAIAFYQVVGTQYPAFGCYHPSLHDISVRHMEGFGFDVGQHVGLPGVAGHRPLRLRLGLLIGKSLLLVQNFLLPRNILARSFLLFSENHSLL